MSKINKAIAALSAVASLGVAAAPMATFATPITNPRGVTDTLSVTIEGVCSFGYTTGSIAPGAHINGTGSTYNGSIDTNPDTTQANTPSDGIAAGKGYGAWSSNTLTAYDIPSTGEPSKSGETAYGIMEAGTNNTNFAQTDLTIVCNNKNGYTLTATPGALTGAVNAETIAAAGYGDSVTTSTWGYKFAVKSGYSGNTNQLETTATTWNANASAAQVITLDSSDHGVATNATGDQFTVTYGVSTASNLSADTYTGTIDYRLAQI